MEILAIIPSRKGSKRILNKNILPLNGKPMIEWTIDATIESKYIDAIVINSDCDIVKEITKKYQENCKSKEIIFMQRPEWLAGDMVTTQAVVDDVLKIYKCDTNLILQVTSPLRTVEWIDKCIELFLKEHFESVFTVKEVFPHVYCPNGAVYVFKEKLYSNNSSMVLMPPESSIDIDTPLDLRITEMLMKDRL
ncbi:MAG: acylneuraminate cytidylyltransferase family protein [Actinobacteria bacterium]|nr:acylneuraminate cytidylyltransferase family protein [Actinomycetota bacterium]MBE3114628.1 acylneuraminate cytidylyltransferase family protein [Actinomycetota bacterium]